MPWPTDHPPFPEVTVVLCRVPSPSFSRRPLGRTPVSVSVRLIFDPIFSCPARPWAGRLKFYSSQTLRPRSLRQFIDNPCSLGQILLFRYSCQHFPFSPFLLNVPLPASHSVASGGWLRSANLLSLPIYTWAITLSLFDGCFQTHFSVLLSSPLFLSLSHLFGTSPHNVLVVPILTMELLPHRLTPCYLGSASRLVFFWPVLSFIHRPIWVLLK